VKLIPMKSTSRVAIVNRVYSDTMTSVTMTNIANRSNSKQSTPTTYIDTEV